MYQQVGNKPLEISEVCHLNDISRSPVSEPCGHVVSSVKDKVLHLFPPTTEKEAPSLAGLRGVQRQHTPHLCLLFGPIF